MAHSLGIVGASLIAAFMVAGSANAAAAGSGAATAAAAAANGGCVAVGNAVPASLPRSSSKAPTAEPAASTWDKHPVASNVGINSPYSLLATGTKTAVVLAVDRSIDRLIVWSTKDSGGTWHATAKLNEASLFGAASDGSSIDLLMAIAHTTSSALVGPADSHGQQLLYRRSLNGGARWSASQKLGTLSYPEFAVARAGSTVAVTWWNERDELRVRVSQDDGATFGSASTIATFQGTSGCVDPGPGSVGVAFSGRQILVTYLTGFPGQTTLRRGLHDGRHWTSAAVLGGHRGLAPLAAHGKDVVAIVTPKLELLSHDSGATWQHVTNPVGTGAGEVHLVWGDGSWRLAYYAEDSTIRYRDSADATHWSPSELVATNQGTVSVDVDGVAAAGRPLVLLANVSGGMKVTDLEVATRN